METISTTQNCEPMLFLESTPKCMLSSEETPQNAISLELQPFSEDRLAMSDQMGPGWDAIAI